MTKNIQKLWVVVCAIFLFIGNAYAQPGKLNVSLYGGAGTYQGDNDRYASDDVGPIRDFASNPGVSLGAELSYGLTEKADLALRGVWGYYPEIEDQRFFAANTNPDKSRLTGALLLRYQIFSGLVGRGFSPYINLGLNATQKSNQDPANRKLNGITENMAAAAGLKPKTGFGPVTGFGILSTLGRIRWGLEVNSFWTRPDVAIDASDPTLDKNGSSFLGSFFKPLGAGDLTDWDFLGMLGAHITYNLQEGKVCKPALVANVNAPSGTVNMGDAVSFSMGVVPTATLPVSYMWDFGDGNTATGATATHTYSRAGTYTVTSSAMNCKGTDSKTATVNVVDPCASNPAKISAANAPSTLEAGKSGSFSVNATGSCQLSYTWEFGDGSTATGTNVSRSYANAGTYTVKVTAKNAAGSDSRTFRVTVNAPAPPPDPCAKLTELNSVYFDYGKTTLSAEAMSLLDENVAALKDCPNVKVAITGYSDSSENSMSLSERRAKALADYYVSKGIGADRLTSRGAGVDAVDCDKEDPGKGCRRNRRGESVPVR